MQLSCSTKVGEVVKDRDGNEYRVTASIYAGWRLESLTDGDEYDWTVSTGLNLREVTRYA